MDNGKVSEGPRQAANSTGRRDGDEQHRPRIALQIKRESRFVRANVGDKYVLEELIENRLRDRRRAVRARHFSRKKPGRRRNDDGLPICWERSGKGRLRFSEATDGFVAIIRRRSSMSASAKNCLLMSAGDLDGVKQGRGRA